jgi:hypothetical protein
MEGPGASIEGPGSGEDVGIGVGAGTGRTGTTGTLSVFGATETGAGIVAWCVDTDLPELLVLNSIVASDQLINGLKR